MANPALRALLREIMDTLTDRPDGRRWTIRELARATETNRSTLYGWLAGTPPTSNLLDDFAGQLAKLVAQGDPGRAEQLLPGLKKRLVTAIEAPEQESTRVELGFVEYPPICDIPTGSTGEDGERPAAWTFLGSLLRVLQRSSGRPPRWERVPVGAFETNDFAILAGFFAAPERAPRWHFLRTPVQVPLNAVVLWRDVVAFVRHVLPTRKKSLAGFGEELYVDLLQRALWQPHAQDHAPVVHPDIVPLTIRGEAGRQYVKDVLGYEEAQLPDRADDEVGIDPSDLQNWLVQTSEKFQRAVSSGEVGSPDLRLPVLIVDELTCLRVLGTRSRRDSWLATEPILLSSPKADICTGFLRPRFNVSVAIDKSERAGGLDFESVRAAFEEFLWSNVGMVSAHYARLLKELTATLRATSAVGDVAPLYALQWLSIELEPHEQAAILEDESPVAIDLARISSPATHDCGAWSDILRGAKTLLLADSDVRRDLKSALLDLKEAASPNTPVASPAKGIK